MTIGEKIKKRRFFFRTNTRRCCKKIGVALQTIYKYENGIVTNIPIEKIEKLADALQTTPEYLLGWDRPIDDLDRRVLQLYPDFVPGKNYLPLDTHSKKCIPIESFPDRHTDPNEILYNYNKLNSLGKRKVSEYIDDLVENPKYTKDN